MEGEPKKEMYDLLPPEYCPKSFNVLPSASFESIVHSMKEFGINFPCIAKPEIGGQGILVRKIDDETHLKHYHSNTPVEYIVQEMISYPMEVSIFYYRFPEQPKGLITGFLCKIPLEVTGNGKSTLHELIKHHPKAKKRIEELEREHKDNFDKVIPKGEKFRLCHAANHNRGAQFIDLKEHIDDKLVTVLDKISHSINDFFYGRYDIMCKSIEDLKEGKNFSILEYNGCGAEPNHFYDTGYTLMGAYKEILSHWNALYKISRHNHKKGHKSWPLMKGVKFLKETKKHYKKMKEAETLIR
jgi:hypothetical protein